MLRLDLDAAGLPYVVEGPDGPLFADFHSLRHSYLTLGGRAGIDLRTLQELARHSTPTLTARYSHRRLYDLAGAVEKLPSILPTAASTTEPLAATGTDGTCATVPQPDTMFPDGGGGEICLRTVCAPDAIGGDSRGLAGTGTVDAAENDTGRNPLPLRLVAPGQHSPNLVGTNAGEEIRSDVAHHVKVASTPGCSTRRNQSGRQESNLPQAAYQTAASPPGPRPESPSALYRTRTGRRRFAEFADSRQGGAESGEFAACPTEGRHGEDDRI